MALFSCIRFRPFSHDAKTLCLLPNSTFACQIFPSLIRFYDYDQKSPKLVGTIHFKDLGPLEQFTVIQDLEGGALFVSGVSPSGFVRYSITAGSLEFLKLGAETTLEIWFQDKEEIVRVRQKSCLEIPVAIKAAEAKERLFLGVDRSQEWPMVMRRLDMREILPYWHFLGQSVPQPAEQGPLGKGPSLFTELAGLIEEKKRAEVLAALKALFQAGFSHQLIPSLEDVNFHGYPLPVAENQNTSPLLLLKEIFTIIRSLFFVEESNAFQFLPLIPKEFHCGTLASVKTHKGHILHLEWTKQTIRRVLVEAGSDDAVCCSFHSPVAAFRMGRFSFDNHSILQFRAGKKYLLDNFRK
jgi:hypothetical protein